MLRSVTRVIPRLEALHFQSHGITVVCTTPPGPPGGERDDENDDQLLEA